MTTSKLQRRKNKKVQQQEAPGLQEPVRISLLNVVEENLLAANRGVDDENHNKNDGRSQLLELFGNVYRKNVVYVHRVIFVAEHTFRHEGMEVENIIQSCIEKVNNNYHDEKLTGMLLHYEKYFAHLLEGSEDSIYRHMKCFFGNTNYGKHIVKMKLLHIENHIRQRFMTEWFSYIGTPPKLLEKLDYNIPFVECRAHVFSAIQKMNNLAYHYHRDRMRERQRQKAEKELKEGESNYSMGDEDAPEDEDEDDEKSRINKKRSTFMSGISLYDTYRDYLLDFDTIDFLLNTNYLRDMWEYYVFRLKIDNADFYRDATWPIETDFIPYNIFDKPYDPIVDLPKEGKEEEEIQGDTISVAGSIEKVE